MLRRVTVTALLLVLVAAGTAEAAVKPGNYKGKTVQNAAVSLRVLTNRKAVVQYSWEGAVLNCSNGKTLQLGGDKTPLSNKFPIGPKGQFGFTGGASNGSVAIEVKGKIKSPRANGTLRMAAKVAEDGTLDPNGTVTCDSGSVAWKAKQ